MKNLKTLLLAVFLFIYSNCVGQDKGYIALSVGPSIPVGDFASKNVGSETAGLANSGAIFDLTFAYKLGLNFGITAMIRGQANPVDNETFLDALNDEDPTIDWDVDSKYWGLGGLMFGAYGSFPIGTGNTSFETRGMIGFLRGTSPELTITGIQNGISEWVRINSEKGSSFSYLIGAGFKFNVGSKICLLANLDYMGSKPEFRNVKTTTSIGTFEESTFSQSMGTVNLGFGIGLRL